VIDRSLRLLQTSVELMISLVIAKLLFTYKQRRSHSLLLSFMLNKLVEQTYTTKSRPYSSSLDLSIHLVSLYQSRWFVYLLPSYSTVKIDIPYNNLPVGDESRDAVKGDS
jgi:hypothetical protein